MYLHLNQNSRKPIGIRGKVMANRMNGGAHAALSEWGMAHLHPGSDADALDIGCGGGANLARLLQMSPKGTATGADYSAVSVRESRKFNRIEVAQGRCEVVQADVAALPFPDDSFDAATAYETIYFWPDVPRALREVLRVLKPGGVLMVCNEADGVNVTGEEWKPTAGELTVYTEEQLLAFFRDAGFVKIESDGDAQKGWLCVLGRKCNDEEKR